MHAQTNSKQTSSKGTTVDQQATVSCPDKVAFTQIYYCYHSVPISCAYIHREPNIRTIFWHNDSRTAEDQAKLKWRIRYSCMIVKNLNLRTTCVLYCHSQAENFDKAPVESSVFELISPDGLGIGPPRYLY